MNKVFGDFRLRKKEYVKKEVFFALADHTPKDEAWMQFKKGDQFIFKSEEGPDCWQVERLASEERGYVNPNLLERGSDVFLNYEWISFDVPFEADADKILKKAKYTAGAFLIRPRIDNKSTQNIRFSLTLSVKIADPINPILSVKILREGKAFRIENNQIFETLSDLVYHYADYKNQNLSRVNSAENIVLTYSIKKKEFVSLWTYSKEAITTGKVLGEGAFGKVCEGKLYGKEAVSLKSSKEGTICEFMKEAEIARFCMHPYVLRTIGICVPVSLLDEAYIITEFLVNKSLSDYLNKQVAAETCLSSRQCLEIAERVADAMEYLSKMHIVHRDLAARNILVGETIDVIKVADFGLARNLMDHPHYSTSREGFPFRWTALEGFVIYKGIIPNLTGRVKSAADVWSFGVLL